MAAWYARNHHQCLYKITERLQTSLFPGLQGSAQHDRKASLVVTNGVSSWQVCR